jgi:arsenate reductase
MAEALARERESDAIQASSAGISPLGRVVDATRRVLLECGIRIDGQYSKGLDAVRPEVADVIVNMTGIPGLALFPKLRVVDWDVEDPYGEDLAIYRRVREDIEERVRQLAAQFRAENQKSAGE